MVTGCRCEAISEVWRWRGGARGHGVSGNAPWLIASATIDGIRQGLLEISPQWLGVGMNRVIPDKVMCVGIDLVVIRPDKRINALLGARGAVFAIRDVGSCGLSPRRQTLVTPLMSANAWLQTTSAICSQVGGHAYGDGLKPSTGGKSSGRAGSELTCDVVTADVLADVPATARTRLRYLVDHRF